jgi:hypothetical protein
MRLSDILLSVCRRYAGGLKIRGAKSLTLARDKETYAIKVSSLGLKERRVIEINRRHAQRGAEGFVGFDVALCDPTDR